ncbi:MAG: PfkB family carbohydrate kinase [Anaerolineae bacterium]
MKPSQSPDFVVVGHVCQDILPEGGLALGGSVSYAATTAQRLGRRVGVVTSAGPGLDVSAALPGMEVVCHQAASTTIFENIYLETGRKQILHSRAAVITCEHIPLAWRDAPVVYLGSIDREISPGVFHCFSDKSLVGIMPQGFFRRWDEHGQVHYAEWTPSPALLEQLDVLVISELDVPDPNRLVRDWGRYIRIIVVTQADQGATVYKSDEVCHYPARPAQEVEPTGAGDVFTAAFLIRLAETGDPCQAAQFANVVASFSVEGIGMAAIPHRQRVDDFLRTVPAVLST